MKKFFKKIALAVSVFSFVNVAQAKGPIGAVSCDGKEINSAGELNLDQYLLQNYHKPRNMSLAEFESIAGSVEKLAELNKRHIGTKEFFSKPRGSIRSLQKTLFALIDFHNEAAQSGQPGFTKKSITSTSKFRGYDFDARQAKLSEDYTVTLKGSNKAVLTCDKRDPHAEAAEWVEVAGGQIAHPGGFTAYSCSLIGTFSDIAPQLHSIFQEVYSSQMLPSIMQDEDVARARKVCGGDSTNCFSDELVFLKNHPEYKKVKANKFRSFIFPLNCKGGGDGFCLGPVNQTIVNQNNGATRPTLSSREALNAIAYVIGDSMYPCDISLVCTASNCSLVSNKEYRDAESKLSYEQK